MLPSWTFLVCIKEAPKEAPDVDTPFSVQNGEFALYADRVTLNAYDASATGAVLRLIEEHGGDIEVVAVRPEDGIETIRESPGEIAE